MKEIDDIAHLALRVASKDSLARDIVGFELMRADGGELPVFTPGSHLFVKAPNGLLRQYSLCNSPSERDRYVIAVKREAAGRGGSESIASTLQVGDTVQVSEPRNAFPLDVSAPRYLFIAGGIGITPIRAMVLHLIGMGITSFKLVYCTRSQDDTAFISAFGAPEFRGKVIIHHDEGDAEKRLDLWPLLETSGRTHLYCCGPAPLMQSVRDMSGHWPASAVHFEDFGAVKPKPREDDSAFEVALVRSKKTLTVAAGTTLLKTLQDAGIDVASSCESGTCGSCRVRLLDGQPDHRDFVLAEDERPDFIMACVSRAASKKIALDL